MDAISGYIGAVGVIIETTITHIVGAEVIIITFIIIITLGVNLGREN
jgi:hypothetical protein